MNRRVALAPGQKVRIVGEPVNLTLRSSYGVLLKLETEDCWLVRLNAPAIYHCADGTTEELTEILEMADNLRVVHSR